MYRVRSRQVQRRQGRDNQQARQRARLRRVPPGPTLAQRRHVLFQLPGGLAQRQRGQHVVREVRRGTQERTAPERRCRMRGVRAGTFSRARRRRSAAASRGGPTTSRARSSARRVGGAIHGAAIPRPLACCVLPGFRNQTTPGVVPALHSGPANNLEANGVHCARKHLKGGPRGHGLPGVRRRTQRPPATAARPASRAPGSRHTVHAVRRGAVPPAPWVRRAARRALRGSPKTLPAGRVSAVHPGRPTTSRANGHAQGAA